LYTLLLFMDLMDMDSLASSPNSYPQNGSSREKMSWLEQTSKRMVERVWGSTSSEDIKIAATAYEEEVLGVSPAAAVAAAAADPVYPHCICGIG
jgi:hypothetical protein